VTNGKSPHRDSATATTATVVFMSPTTTTTAEETGFPLRTKDFVDRSIDDDELLLSRTTPICVILISGIKVHCGWAALRVCAVIEPASNCGRVPTR